MEVLGVVTVVTVGPLRGHSSQYGQLSGNGHTQVKEARASEEGKNCNVIFTKEFISLYETAVVVARYSGTVTG